MNSELKTSVNELRGVLQTVRNKTCSVDDAVEYIIFAFKKIIDVPIGDDPDEKLVDYYGAWRDHTVEINQRFDDFIKGTNI